MERFSSYDFVNIIVLNIKEPRNIVNNRSKKNQINSSDHKKKKKNLFIYYLFKNNNNITSLKINKNPSILY